MKLMLLSYPEFFAGESDILCSLMDKYEFTFHLRKPNASNQDYDIFMQSISKEFHNRIVLHDAYNLQQKYQVKGLHFSTINRSVAENIITHGTKSTSCHSVAEARTQDGIFDYLFLSPVFKSISKPGYTGNLDMPEVKAYLSEQRKTQIIALGGIDETKIQGLKNYMFDGVAVLGAVWTNNPEVNNVTIENNLNKIYKCMDSDHIA